MIEEKGSYRQIMKATSLYGGVQIFNILIQVLRSKIIAVLLGPTGMGIAGLLNSSIVLISGLTSFGLGTSAVKNIAEANESSNGTKIIIVSSVLKKLVWVTGIIGLILSIVFSKWLSKITFGNYDYKFAYILISIVILFNQLSKGQLAILQGLRKLKYLAKANTLGSLIGLIITIPIYYKWGINGIVPSIIVSSFVSLFLSWHFSNKVKLKKQSISFYKTYIEGKGMLSMGFMISVSGLITTGSAYLIRIFISSKGGIEDVGLFTAGFSIINNYVGLVFTAMIADYYPRLSSVSYSNELCKQTINQQAEIAILILAPIVIIFFIFAKPIIIILYSQKFIPIENMINWAALGMLFKAASWSVSILLLAKGVPKLLLANELLSNAYMLTLNILGYKYFGLTGLGISFLIGYLIYLIQVFFLNKYKFEFMFNKTFIIIFILQLSTTISSFIVYQCLEGVIKYILCFLLLSISVYYSISELNKRLNLLDLIKKFKNKIY